MSDAERIVGNYGIDSPRVVRSLGVIVASSLLVTVVAGIVDEVAVMAAGFVLALLVSMAGLVLVRSSRVHKIRERVRLVDRIALEGDERVLDVGCGRGLLLVEVARRLGGGGRAIGVDAWRANDLEDAEVVFDNASTEGADDRVDVTSGDARSLPFADGSFRAVVSGLALHHIEGFDSRVQAIREIARVIEPTGRVVLIDRHHTRVYVDALRACNFVDVVRSRRVWRLLPPARYVTGTKPEVGASVWTPAPVEAPEPPPPGATQLERAVPSEPDEVVEVAEVAEAAEVAELADTPLVEVRLVVPEVSEPVTVTGGRDGAPDESEDGAPV